MLDGQETLYVLLLILCWWILAVYHVLSGKTKSVPVSHPGFADPFLEILKLL